jgi:chorismate mutase
MIHIPKQTLSDLLRERESLYAEIARYKEENTTLFNDLQSAEDRVEELEDTILENENDNGAENMI